MSQDVSLPETEPEEDSVMEAGSSSAKNWLAYLEQVYPDPFPARRVAIEYPSFHIGRGISSDRQLGLNSPKVSRNCLQLTYGSQGWRVSNLSAKKRASLNGRKLPLNLAKDLSAREYELNDGAILRVGENLFVFREGRCPPPQTENELSEELEALPGRSRLISKVRAELRQAAGHQQPVLLLGETGSGKTVAANFIHQWSNSKQGKLESLNCAGLSKERFEQTLFGSEKGAFTGATTRVPGLVELSKDGSLFLDELGLLEFKVQGALLTFIETGEFRSMGSSRSQSSRAQLIAATNANLEQEVIEGSFREDLLARFGKRQSPIVLPPLRDRPEDLVDWLRALCHKAPQALRESLNEGSYGADFLEYLMLYDWPMNLRKLEVVIAGLERSPIDLAGKKQPDWVAEDNQPHYSLWQNRQSRRAEEIEYHWKSELQEEPDTTQSGPELTKEIIEQQLKAAQGNIVKAAGHLGLSRYQLYREMKKRGVERSKFR